MAITLLTGGARAGKSRLATSLAARTGSPVVFVATAEALDDEMAGRIARHRANRPREWTTIEEPLDLARVLTEVDGRAAVIVDCLTLWVSNLLQKGDDDETIAGLAADTVAVAVARESPTFVVTNEVGSGVVPVSELGRRFQDLLGRVNAIWSDASTHAYLVVAGRALALEKLT
jgi:adenosyl cobinamide kinase/adenosyl cobinamide phosphate guanylyltransferase